MSHGFGTMQDWLVTTLYCHPRGKTVGALHREYLKETADEESSAEDRARSVRNSMTRALRGLEKLGKVKRGEDGLWLSTETIVVANAYWRKATAYHEAGHAVIGLAVGLPVAFACITQDDRRRSGYVSKFRPPSSVGYLYKMSGKGKRLDTRSKAAALDAFGNPVRKHEPTSEEHHGEVLMCIAGGMAEAKLLGEPSEDWRRLASSLDKSIASGHRGRLGGAAKSWEEYENDTAALVNEHWAKIGAVAARLMEVDVVGASEIDRICQRVVRRQHLKSESKGAAGLSRGSGYCARESLVRLTVTLTCFDVGSNRPPSPCSRPTFTHSSRLTGPV
jgi:hypothetical protein